MRRLLLAGPIFLAGCFLLPGGRRSEVREVPEAMRDTRPAVPPAPDRYPFNVEALASLEPGPWVTYRDGERTFTIAAVGREGDDLWIEIIEEGEPRLASARRVGRDGTVREAWYREVGARGRTKVEPQPLRQWDPPSEPARERRGAEYGVEPVRVGSRELEARRVRERLEDLEGRIVERITLWHEEVPRLYDGSEHGGLVALRSEGRPVELVAFGSDAAALVEVPR